MPLLNPDHLLDQAERLISSPSRGAPRQADLRRAISNAYYAVFHAILAQAADDLIGSTHRSSSRYALIYRSVDHRSLRNLCEDVVKPKLPARYAKYALREGFGLDLVALAIAVIELQEKRYLADYDPLYRVGMSDTKSVIATSRRALIRFKSADRALRGTFLDLLLFSPR